MPLILPAEVLTSIFVLISLVLVVGVPVTLATPGQWETSKNSIYQLILIWIVLVFGIAETSTLFLGQ